MTTRPRYHVFLSHHAADQPAVEAIARHLRSADLSPFLDRWHLIPGEPWQEAIEQALASSETMAVFVGPSGIGPWQNEEMRVALYDSAVRGKRVIPVLLPGADPQRVSPFLTRRTWVDFSAGPEDAGALQRLIAGIQGQASEAGGFLSPLNLAPSQRYFTPFQAPPLPPYFVPRPEATEAIRAALLDARSDRPGVLAISAVHGLGGIGKTTLIAALAHDPAIRQRYPDGILWVTLGQQPELFPRLLECIQQLGDYTFKPTTPEGASSHLRTLLIDKACLLVVDDAWQREHVDHFLVGGPRSHVVITTRDATLARKLRAHLHDLDVMTEAQALALFEGRLGTLPAANGRDHAAGLARELGYLPLALELAAAQIESGRSWDELLSHFRSAFADLSILDLDEPTRRDESLRICFANSLDSLTEEDRNAFVWFGVLPGNVTIGPAIAATLWDEVEVQARERLRRLGHKALLKPVGEDVYTLHDLLHNEATSRLAQQMTIPDAHGTLLARYQVRTVDGSWHTLASDGYIHTHLVWHMVQAERWGELHTLVAEGTGGSLPWATARYRLEGSYAGYLADVSLAWERTEGERPRVPVAVGRQARYALIGSSMHSLSANLPPNLLAALVERMVGGWTPEAALGYALQIPDEYQRTAAVCHLVKLVPTEMSDGLLSVVEGLTNAYHRLMALKILTEHLSPELRDQALLDAWYTASEIDSRTLEDLDGFRIHAHSTGVSDTIRLMELIELLPKMPSDFREQAINGLLADAKGILDDEYRAGVLQKLAEMQPFEQREQMLKEAWAVAQRIDRREGQAAVLIELAAHMAGEQREPVLQEALAAYWSIEDNQAQMKLFDGLLSQLAPDQQEQALQEMLTLVKSRGNDFHALIGLLPHLSSDLRRQTGSEILSGLQSMDEWDRRHYLPRLAQQQVSELVDDILSTAIGITEEEQRAYTLAEMAPHLTPVQLFRSLEAAVHIEDGDYCMVALRGLAPYLTRKEQERVLDKLRSIGSDFACSDWRVLLMLELYPIFPNELYVELTTAIDKLPDNVQQAEFLAKFAGMLTGGRRRQAHAKALGAIRKIRDRGKRVSALTTLTPQLSPVLLTVALEVAEEIGDADPQLRICVRFSSCLPHELLKRTLTAIAGTQNDTLKAEALVKIAGTLPVDLFPSAIQTMRDIQDIMLRTYTVIGMMPHVPIEYRALVISSKPDTVTPLGEAAAALGCWTNEYDRHQVRLPPPAMQPTLPPDMQRSTLRWFVHEKDDIYEATEALVTILPHVSSELAPEFLKAVNERLEGEQRIKALVGLARHLPPLSLAETLAACRDLPKTESELLRHGPFGDYVAAVMPQFGETTDYNLGLAFSITRSQVLTALAPYLRSRNLQSEALAVVGEIESDFLRAEAIAGLAPHLPAEFLQEIVAHANTIEEFELRTWALSGAAQHLPIDDFRQLVSHCRTLSDKSLRRRVWAGLADRWALWAKQMPRDANTLWTETLHLLATRSRQELLSDLEALAPVVVALGGTKAGTEIVRAVMDVGRWWP